VPSAIVSTMFVLYGPDVALGASAHAGCGTIIATKSQSTSVVGLIVISTIIFFMATAFSDRNGCSSEPFDRSAKYWIDIAPRI
jgi:hypothetical protein